VHFVIMGCGRVGSTLAHILEDQGHTVAVVDSNEAAFRRLGSHFAGKRVTGIGFDRDTLIEASSPPGSPVRRSASTTSLPGSTTLAAPRSTSGWAFLRSPQSGGQPTR
jgi:trk system potassium uptake protein TrkA